jgi:hydroxymethylglutaryl-CoA lyase
MKIIECPRDAMQGLDEFIPTAKKIEYINQLLRVGFDTIDFGSFVSPKAIPQLRDTAEVLDGLDMNIGRTKLLAIVANTRGAEDACKFGMISYLGFPLSISETFQKRNTNKSVAEALNTVAEMQDLCVKNGKQLVVYISMGFGNPYGDPYDESIVGEFVDKMNTLGIGIVSLADTIGVSKPGQIGKLFTGLSATFPKMEIGVHLHSNPATAREKIEAAYRSGCQRFDGAIKGYGGCPMAEDDLVGNIATETLVEYLLEQNVPLLMEMDEFSRSIALADTIFPATA